MAKCLAWGIFAAIVFSMLLSCKAREVVVERMAVRTDTVRLVKKDSVRVHDSVFVAQWLQGDTVYIVHDRWHLKERLRVDTVYKSKTDTVVRKETVEKPVERRLAKWEKALMAVGGVSLTALVVIIGVWWYRRKV